MTNLGTMQFFLDSADPAEIAQWIDKVDGITANATMIAKLAKRSYLTQCRAILAETSGKSTSLQVTADNPTMIEKQAHELAALAPNVVVKIPVTTTEGRKLGWLAQKLEQEGFHVNMTAIFKSYQAVREVWINSFFAGRFSYTGNDAAKEFEKMRFEAGYSTKLLWAGVRGPYNIYEAFRSRADIVTVPPDVLKRYFDSRGKQPIEQSLETIREFHRDGSAVKW